MLIEEEECRSKNYKLPLLLPTVVVVELEVTVIIVIPLRLGIASF
jgi:hypothetical protein